MKEAPWGGVIHYLRALHGEEWQRRGKLSLLKDTCGEDPEPRPLIFLLAMGQNHYQAYARSREMSCPWAARKGVSPPQRRTNPFPLTFDDSGDHHMVLWADGYGVLVG